MSLKTILFPLVSRDFVGMRWADIFLRSFHLIGIAGVAGDYLFQATMAAMLPFWEIAFYSGLAMMGLSIWSNGRWLLQLRGAVIFGKLLLLWSLPWLEVSFENGAAWGFLLIILLSSVIAHAPARVRYCYVLKRASAETG